MLGLFFATALFIGTGILTFDYKSSIPMVNHLIYFVQCFVQTNKYCVFIYDTKLAKQYPRNAANGSEKHYII